MLLFKLFLDVIINWKQALCKVTWGRPGKTEDSEQQVHQPLFKAPPLLNDCNNCTAISAVWSCPPRAVGQQLISCPLPLGDIWATCRGSVQLPARGARTQVCIYIPSQARAARWGRGSGRFRALKSLHSNTLYRSYYSVENTFEACMWSGHMASWRHLKKITFYISFYWIRRICGLMPFHTAFQSSKTWPKDFFVKLQMDRVTLWLNSC